jgi:hypothetical protein
MTARWTLHHPTTADSEAHEINWLQYVDKLAQPQPGCAAAPESTLQAVPSGSWSRPCKGMHSIRSDKTPLRSGCYVNSSNIYALGSWQAVSAFIVSAAALVADEVSVARWCPFASSGQQLALIGDANTSQGLARDRDTDLVGLDVSASRFCTSVRG